MEVETLRTGGMELFSVALEHVETVSVAFVVRAGSAHETEDVAGISHFLEHVSFRGSENFSMREIKYTVESVGGTLNAFTGRTSTVYYFKVPDFRAKDAFEVVADLVFRPKISPEDVEVERKVILQEYMMSLENPEDRLHDMALESVWGIPYGRPIMGRRKSIESITADELSSYHNEMYVPERVKVIAVGKVDVLDFEDLEIPDPTGKGTKDPEDPVFKRDSGKYITMRDLEHVHVLLMKESPGMMSEDYPKLLVLNTILGSGMSSYLFEEVREKEGLVYEISSELYTLKSAGILGIYFSTSPDNVEKTLEKLKKSLRELKVREYVDYGKGRFIGKLKMLTESPGGLMWFYVDQIGLGIFRNPEDYRGMVESMGIEELEDFKEGILHGKWTVFGVGPEGYELNTLEIEV